MVLIECITPTFRRAHFHRILSCIMLITPANKQQAAVKHVSDISTAIRSVNKTNIFTSPFIQHKFLFHVLRYKWFDPIPFHSSNGNIHQKHKTRMYPLMELDYYFYPDEYLEYDLDDLNIPVSIFFETCEDELEDYPLPHAKNEKFRLDFGISDFNIK